MINTLVNFFVLSPVPGFGGMGVWRAGNITVAQLAAVNSRQYSMIVYNTVTYTSTVNLPHDMKTINRTSREPRGNTARKVFLNVVIRET